jgi:hypothetical protein
MCFIPFSVFPTKEGRNVLQFDIISNTFSVLVYDL